MTAARLVVIKPFLFKLLKLLIMTLLEKALLSLKPVATETPLIRIGGGGDGGYLCPDDLNGIGGCISPGASNIKHFEDQLWEVWGIPSVLIDASSSEDKFLTPMLDGQTLVRKWLLPRKGHDAIDLKEAINHPLLRSDRDLILQLDIEGAEYANINSWDKGLLNRFRVIVLELHGLGFLDRPWRPRAQSIMEAICRLGSTHTCVHFHPNNCCGSFVLAGSDLSIPNVVECTFHRNDRIESTGVNSVCLPHELDSKNHVDTPDLIADPAWVESSFDFERRLQYGRRIRMSTGIRIEVFSALKKIGII